jgi:hypothetical protein
MLDLQYQYNKCTTTPHMSVGPTHWDPPSCEGLLYTCCNGVVQESNPNSGEGKTGQRGFDGSEFWHGKGLR